LHVIVSNFAKKYPPLMQNWDDLRIFMAAARAGSLSSAGRALGIDAATVGRRLARLESSMKSTLLVRSVAGLQLTSAGTRLLKIGMDAETAMDDVARASDTDAAGGTVRLSVAEGFGTTIVAPALPGLRRQRPGLNIELAANAGFLSPSTREVDMAVTLSAPPQTRLVVEPLTDYRLGLFASLDYLETAGVPNHPDDLHQHDIVGYVDDLIYAPELRFLDEILPRLRPALTSSSIRAQREIIRAGGGIGVLPCFMSETLEPVLADQILLTRRFWISTHRDIADTARMRALRQWMKALVEANAQRLLPSPPV
jgi:DNA-binding transcriptional LysR family regulator